MKKIVILVENLYQVLEVWYPLLRFREEGYAVIVAGPEKQTYASKEGYPVEAQAAVRCLAPADFDAVVIPGGYAPDILRRFDEINRFVADMYSAKKIVAAICHGGWVLVSAGILKGAKVTGFSAIKDDLVNAGASYANQEVVVDKNLITSRNPYDLGAFCRAIIQGLR
jgi:protease I